MSRILIALALVLGCGSKHPPPATTTPPPVKPSEGLVTLDVDPADAEVQIDGTARGTASALGGGITLSRGVHQIVLSKRGFEVWRGEVEVSGQTEKLQVKLVPAK